jgi:hypothetical protein
MTDPAPHDLSEPAPTVERTSVLAVGDLEAHDVRRALVALAALRGPSLAPLARTTAVPGGVALVHRVPLGAVEVGALRRAAPLRSGHVLAVGVAVLEALVELHAAGLAHGAVNADAVLVGPDGGVVLAGTGAAWRVAPGEPDGPTAAADVAAVGELLRDLLGPGSAPAPLVVAVVRATDPDLALRPGAAALLGSLRRCGRPDSLLDALWTPAAAHQADDGSGDQPADEPGPDDEDSTDDVSTAIAEASAPTVGPARDVRALRRRTEPGGQARAPRRRGRPRRRAGSARRPTGGRLVVAALALLVGIGAASMIGDRQAATATADPGTADPALRPAASAAPTVATVATPTLSPATAAPPVDWRTVLADADRGRTAALAAGSTALLREWVTGTAYLADVALARTIAASGAQLVGGSLVLEAVSVVEAGPVRAVLQVRDRRSAYAVVVDGARQEVPERAARTWTVTLVRGGSPVRWRIEEVVDAALSPGGRR